MSYHPPPSPPLPTFAIKDLCGPSNPPGLISISKRRYDATLKSIPDAALLYLDDDDGELITIGSSFELDQRLEEPVPKYIRELRDPADGKLVHVFDINHSAASLIEWRDHEAYSSKHFNSLSSPYHTPRADRDSLPRCLSPSVANSHVTYPDLPEPHPEEPASCNVHTGTTQATLSKQKQPVEESSNILDGIEEHLSGLANVLQIAANTLRKAADKTHDTDTSVIEDILKGVKGILTEVGSFGIEAFKELGAEIKTVTNERSTVSSAHGPVEATAATAGEEIAAQLAQEAKEEHDFRSARKESQSPEENLQSSTYYNAEVTPSEDLTTKVKFALPEGTAQKRPVSVDSTQTFAKCPRSARPDSSSKSEVLCGAPKIEPQNPSFLDDSSEDADFTARYPPLSTVRRTRSAIERPLHWPVDRREKIKAQCKYYRSLAAVERETLCEPVRSPSSATISPFASPRPQIANETIITGKASLEEKVESADTVQKPLPGAWPDVKSDAVSAQPTSRESSGDFFNRMVGRGRPGRYRGPITDSGLHRANTTASSNPASRLNGPFDPGFPYDASNASSHKPGVFRPYRPHRRSASPSQNWRSLFPAAPLENDKRSSLAFDTGSTPSGPTTRNHDTPADTASQTSAGTYRSRIDSHRAVKHHRSVPQFHASPPLPYQIMKSKPVSNDAFGSVQRSALDFLSGPPMPMPPPMPFTSRPNFAPNTVAPNLWAPWQSSPPMQLAADEGTNISSLNEYSTYNETSSPVSSQSTTTRDFDIPGNEPPFPSAQPHMVSSPSMYRYPTPPRPQPPLPALPTFFPPPPSSECMRIEPVKDKIDECVEQLKMCGFGVDDENLKNRLHVYAVAADGEVTEAVEMIEQDRRMTAPGRFD